MQNKLIKICILFAAFCSLSLNAQVNMSDLKAWNRIHQEALDSHTLWSKMHLIKSFQKDGSEKRIYVNRVPEKNVQGCIFQGAVRYVKEECHTRNPCLKDLGTIVTESQMDDYLSCSEKQFGCDNIFVIKDKIVLSYLPVGNCYTNSATRPDPKYKPLSDKLEIVIPNGF